jgi:hypothetical protein
MFDYKIVTMKLIKITLTHLITKKNISVVVLVDTTRHNDKIISERKESIKKQSNFKFSSHANKRMINQTST